MSRIWSNFDLGVITFLLHDSVGGLEFQNRDQHGTFIRVECNSPAELVVVHARHCSVGPTGLYLPGYVESIYQRVLRTTVLGRCLRGTRSQTSVRQIDRLPSGL